MPAKKIPLLTRLISGTERRGACLEWTKAHDVDGYGLLRISGLMERAHRVSFSLFIGDIEAGKSVCHSCDNPRCIEPEHLFLGTALDNQRDKVKKGRQARGSAHGQHTMPGAWGERKRDELGRFS